VLCFPCPKKALQGGARLRIQWLESHPLRQPFKLQDFLRLSHRLSHFFRHFSLTFPTAQYLSLRKKRRGQDSESLTDGEVRSKRREEEPAGLGVRRWTHHRDGPHHQAVIALWRGSVWTRGPEAQQQLSRFRRVLGRRGWDFNGGLVLRHLLVGSGGPIAGENVNASIGGYPVLYSANY
jgi:hypothetical protein